MADARFPVEWMTDPRVRGLSGEHVRVLMHALAWSATARTDGVILFEYLPMVPCLDGDALAAFVAADLAAELDGGWLLTVYSTTQTTRAEFEASDYARAKARERKANQRKRNAADQGQVTSDVTSDVHRDNTGRQAGRLSSNVSSSSSNKRTDKNQEHARGENTAAEPELLPLSDAERAALDARADRIAREGYDQ
jgi:hypothetical protein